MALPDLAAKRAHLQVLLQGCRLYSAIDARNDFELLCRADPFLAARVFPSTTELLARGYNVSDKTFTFDYDPPSDAVLVATIAAYLRTLDDADNETQFAVERVDLDLDGFMDPVYSYTIKTGYSV